MNVNRTVNPKLQKKQRRKRVRRIVIIVILLIVVAAAALLYIGGKKTASLSYKSYTATIGTISNAISLTGNLEAVNNETLTASSSSTVREIYVKEGDMVEDGDKLLALSNGQRITASFDGKVNKVFVEKDDKVDSGESLVQVVDFNHLKVNVRVDEYDINDVHVGQECKVVTTASKFACNSSISSIDYVSSSTGNVAYYTATAYVDADGTVYPGMQVSMSIPKSEAVDVVILKMDALQFDSFNKAYVLIKNAAGEYVPTYVETGVSNGNYVEIKSGITDGTVVYNVDTSNPDMEAIMSMINSMDDSKGSKGDRGSNPRPDNGDFPGGGAGNGAMPGGN